MAIQLSKKQSDLEKRLKILHNQVYGKSQLTVDSSQLSVKSKDSTNLSDITYLHQDLLKILALSSLAIGGQIILYFLLQKHIVNLNFF
ncbi:MAG: hypothetical protein Q7R43_04690 [Candidatus Daviesbacteria bacterium]|nr:hypothetical protein [Candidatus Daviesbacteria bacterium]